MKGSDFVNKKYSYLIGSSLLFCFCLILGIMTLKDYLLGYPGFTINLYCILCFGSASINFYRFYRKEVIKVRI